MACRHWKPRLSRILLANLNEVSRTVGGTRDHTPCDVPERRDAGFASSIFQGGEHVFAGLAAGFIPHRFRRGAG